MKKILIDARPYKHSYVTMSLESGIDGIILPKGYSRRVKKLGRVQTIAKDGDLRLGKDIVEQTVTPQNWKQIVKQLQVRQAIVHPDTRGMLSLENLIAEAGDGLYVAVSSPEEAKQALSTMQKGPYGIALKPLSPQDIKSVAEIIRQSSETVKLQPAKVTKVQPIGMGDRAFIDTVTMMKPGEGMLVGSTTAGYFFVHAESLENPYTGKRPFRVNAGGVHAYLCTPHDKREYLSEIRAGSQVLIADRKGQTRESIVGRCKIESRPLVLIEASYKGQTISHILQDVATVNLVLPNSKPIPVPQLEPGTNILVRVGEKEGRHYGMKIKEDVIEQ
jgi:3-dehydroquinate synthase II